MAGKTKFYLAEIRVPFLSASLLPAALGAAIAYSHTGTLNYLHLAVTFAGVAALHAGANVANDFFDHKSGCDAANTEFVRPFTGGSRLIQKGLLSPREVLVESFILFALGAACGIYLTVAVGAWALIFGAIGAGCGFFYTAPPLRLSARGVGELMVGINFGTLIVLGSYYIQTGHLSWAPVVASVPLAILIAAVLYINQFQDARADEAAGKRHLVVRLGKRRAAQVFVVLMAAPYVAVALAVKMDAIPKLSLLAILTLPLALKAVLVARKFHSDSRRLTPANVLTIGTHMTVAVSLGAGYLLGK